MNNMVLVTGANGFVGQHLVTSLLERNYAVLATGKGPARFDINRPGLIYRDADITDPVALQSIIEQEKPGIIIHSAAMSQVDDCEKNQPEAHFVNVEATARLLLDAEEHSRFFIFLSTDFVFDGEKGYYSEEDETNPINWYGHTKLEAEAIVQTSGIPWAIVRTCLVFGEAPAGGRNTIFSWIRNSLKEGKSIKVVDDQWRTPTYVKDLVAGIIAIVEKQATGIWHISGEDSVTPYQLAVRIAEKGGWPTDQLERVTASTFQQAGKRPPKTGFSIDKAREQLGFQPLSLDAALAELLSS
jgi:dTDP-4-dehydrorhamnose reductase